MNSNIKIISIIVLISILLVGGYKYYHHNYVETLMLSEIVGETDNPVINIAIKLSDFDTGLTRHDLKQLKNKKGYWLTKMQEIESITDPDLKEQAGLKLLNEMMEDQVLNKICKGILSLGTNTAFSLLEVIL